MVLENEMQELLKMRKMVYAYKDNVDVLNISEISSKLRDIRDALITELDARGVDTSYLNNALLNLQRIVKRQTYDGDYELEMSKEAFSKSVDMMLNLIRFIQYMDQP